MHPRRLNMGYFEKHTTNLAKATGFTEKDIQRAGVQALLEMDKAEVGLMLIKAKAFQKGLMGPGLDIPMPDPVGLEVAALGGLAD
jgi:hypothetical protein